MRPVLMSLLFVLLIAPGVSATEAKPSESVVPEVVPAVVAEVAADAEAGMHLDEITVEERAPIDDAAAAQLGPRGGFWWVVGVIVVAGVILAVIL